MVNLFRFVQRAKRSSNAGSAARVIQRKLHICFKALAAGQFLDFCKEERCDVLAVDIRLVRRLQRRGDDALLPKSRN